VNGTDDRQADEGDTEGVPANNETDVPMRPEDKQYFDGIETELAEAMAVAGRARNQGKDPETTVEISIAKDMPARVENILGISGVANRLREL